jgi:hypothetical protein
VGILLVDYLVILFLQIIVLEDTKEYISYAPKEETKAQDRRPFDLLVCDSTGKVKIQMILIFVATKNFYLTITIY